MKKAIRLFALPALATLVVGVACAVNAAIAHNEIPPLWIGKPDIVGLWLLRALVVAGISLVVVDCKKSRWGVAAHWKEPKVGSARTVLDRCGIWYNVLE